MEPLTQTSVVPIRDPSQVALARHKIAEISKHLDLDEQRRSAINIVVTELANNVLQHAGGGDLYIQYLQPIGALEIAAVDHGRGIANIQQCLEDGFSTGSTPGLGLGAVKRFATRFAAYSVLDRTTVISARMTESKTLPEFSVVSTALAGETLSGDSWSVSEDGNTFMVVDGLGHGMLAAEAARAATSIFSESKDPTPATIIEMLHAGMRATRGAAAAVARVHPDSHSIQFCGIGNISCFLMASSRTQSFVSHNGTLGHQVRRIQQFSYPYNSGNLLFMQSDGLTTHSKQGLPASLLQQPPSVIAPFLFSEQVRGRDDATILVNRLG
jgi:anti-sigma regulatory factor (Ser/Thr protein kinase)